MDTTDLWTENPHQKDVKCADNVTRMARGASPAEGSLFVVSDHQWIDRVLSKFVFRAGTKIPLDCKISKLDGNGGT